MSCTGERITLDKGEYVKLIYKVVEPSETEANAYNPRDLTGASIEFQVKQKAGDPDPALISKSVGAGITVLAQSGDTLGKFELVIQTGDTVGLSGGLYTYDIYLIESGERRPLRKASQLQITLPVNLP